MKKYLAITLAAIFIIANATQTFAQINSTQLDEKLDRYVSFPYLSNVDMYGSVSVIFDVNKEGRLDVKNIITDNPNLVDFVERRLDKIILPLDDESIGTTQDVTLNFKKEGDRL